MNAVKKSSGENGSHNDDGNNVIISSQAEAVSSSERRDIARKAALAEAENVLRAVSSSPAEISPSSVPKKKDNNNGINNSTEKLLDVDDNNNNNSSSSGDVENHNSTIITKPKSRSDAVAAAKRRAEERKRAAAAAAKPSSNDQSATKTNNTAAALPTNQSTTTTTVSTATTAAAATTAVNPNSQMDWFNLLGVVTNPGYDSWHGGPPTSATSHHATNYSSHHNYNNRSRHRNNSGGLSSHGKPISLDHVGSDGTRGSTANGITGDSYAASLLSAAGMTELAGYANASSASAQSALNTMAGSLDEFTGWFDHYSRKYLGTVPGIDGGPLMGGEGGGGDDGDDKLGGIVSGLGIGSTMPIWEEFEPEFGPDDIPELQLEELPSDISELDLVSVEQYLKLSGMLGMRFEDRGGGFKAMRERSRNRGMMLEKSEDDVTNDDDDDGNDIDNERVHISTEDNLSTPAEVAKAIEAVPEIFFSSHFDLTDPVCFEKLLVVSDEEVAQIRAKEAELHALAEQKLKEADELARKDAENETTIPTAPPRRSADQSLNSLPDQSGSSLTKEGHETSRPTNAGNVITLRKPETFTLHLDAVELALLDQVRSKSEKFFRETNRFSELQRLVTESVDEVKSLRTEIHSLQERCVTNVELVPIMDNTRADLRAISRVLEGIEDVVNCKASIASLMSAGDHLGAIEALRVARELLTQSPEQESTEDSSSNKEMSQHLSLGKLRALSKVGEQLDEYEKLVVRNITDELVDTFLSWGSESGIDFRAPPRVSLTTDRRAKIRGVVQSLRLCGQLSVAGTTYQKKLCDLITVTVKAIVTECVADAAKTSGNGTDAPVKAGISGVASMSLDQFLDCLKMLFEQVLGLMWGAVAVNKYCISEGILLEDNIAPSNEAANSTDGSAQHSKSATAAALAAAADLSEKSVSELLRLRREAHSLVSFDGMRQLWDTSLTFTLQLERFSGRKAYGLRSTLLAQAKSFVERKHESNMSALVAALDSERWVQCNVSAERQAALTRLCSGRAAFSSRSPARGAETNVPAASTSAPSSVSKMADAEVEGVRYKVVWSCLLLLEMVMDNVTCAAHFQTLATNIVGKVCELLRLFNTRSTHLVLGAGAIHSAARLKSINAKHLAIVTQCIALMLAILPHIRAALMAQLPAKQHALLTDLDKIKSDYSEHSEKVLNKLVSIIGGIVEHSLSAKISQTSFDERAKSMPMPDHEPSATVLECCPFLDSVLTNTTKMHQVLKVMLPDELLRDVFSRIFAYLDHKIPSLYKVAAASDDKTFTMPVTDDGKIRMIKEVQFMTNALNSLAGVLPWNFTAMKILEQELDIIVIQSEPEDVLPQGEDEKKETEVNGDEDSPPFVDSEPSNNKEESQGNVSVNDETSEVDQVLEEQPPTQHTDSSETQDYKPSNDHSKIVEQQSAPTSPELQSSTPSSTPMESAVGEEKGLETDNASTTEEVPPAKEEDV